MNKIINKLGMSIIFVVTSIILGGMLGYGFIQDMDRNIAIDYKVCRYAGQSQEKCYSYYKDSISKEDFMAIVHEYFPKLDN